MIDIKTLGMMIGVGNICFALLVKAYSMSFGFEIPALRLWQWGRIFAGVGMILNITRPSLPVDVPLFFSHALLIAGWGIEAIAHVLLVNRIRTVWRAYSALAILISIHTLVVFWVPARGVATLSLCVAGFLLFAVMAYSMLTTQQAEKRLIYIIGSINLLVSFSFLPRALDGLIDSVLIPFDSRQFSTLLLYISGYVMMIVNGFGFLLLAKQSVDLSLQKALFQVENSEAEQRQLLSIASHEFRTPAAMIKASLDSLRYLQANLSADVVLRLDNMRNATNRLMDFANKLITQDRLTDLALKPQKSIVDLNKLIEQCVASYPEDARLVLYLPEQSPFIYLDATLIGIAIANLIDNALQINTLSTLPHPCVELAVWPQDNQIYIQVSDDGPGLSEAEKSKIFDRFYSTKKNVIGGLGLSIVKTIVQAHQGHIAVSDHHPTGICMQIMLPRMSPVAGSV